MAKRKSQPLGRLTSRVDRADRVALDRAPTAEELQANNDLVEELRTLAAADDSEKYMKLLRRAKVVKRRLTDPRRVQQAIERGRRAKMRGLGEALPAGIVRSSRLARAGHEVLGGLPGTRRGH
ncbi:hypothetical protein PJI74_01145 [Mycobacterium kansasii]